MKKLVALVLALVLCLSVVGCSSKNEYVTEAEALIDAIGTVTLDSKEAIFKAEQAYEYLLPEEKEQVENYETLLAAQAAYEALFTDVEITMDNWAQYLELVEKPVWQMNGFGEADYYNSNAVIKVKDEYKDRIDYVNLDLTVEIGYTMKYRTYEADWTNCTIEFGTKTLPYMKDEKRAETFTYDNNNAKWKEDVEVSLAAGYMTEADLDEYSLEILNGDMSELCEVHGGFVEKNNTWKQNGKLCGTIYDDFQVLRIKGTMKVAE